MDEHWSIWSISRGQALEYLESSRLEDLLYTSYVKKKQRNIDISVEDEFHVFHTFSDIYTAS